MVHRLNFADPPERRWAALLLASASTGLIISAPRLSVVNDHLIEPRLLRLTDSNGQPVPLYRARVATEFGLTEDYDGICNHPTPVMVEQRRQPGFAVPPLSVSIIELP